MAAVAWPDAEESRCAGPVVRAWTRTVGPGSPRTRVDCRSVGFRREAFLRAGGFPAHLATAEDEAFGRAVRASGGQVRAAGRRCVTWWQRDTVGGCVPTVPRIRPRWRCLSVARLILNDGVRAGAYPVMVAGILRRGPAGRSAP